jgi:hypothetical protein
MTNDERSIMIAGLEREIGERSKALASVMDFDVRRMTEGYVVPGDVTQTAGIILQRAEDAADKIDTTASSLRWALKLYMELREAKT